MVHEIFKRTCSSSFSSNDGDVLLANDDGKQLAGHAWQNLVPRARSIVSPSQLGGDSMVARLRLRMCTLEL